MTSEKRQFLKVSDCLLFMIKGYNDFIYLEGDER